MSQYNNYFCDKVVIITGCGSTIGQTIAQEFAKLNARIVYADIDSEKAAKVCQSLRSNSPNNYSPLQIIGDLSDDQNISRLIGETVEKLGRIDVLVNNAGIYQTYGSETPSALSEFDQIISINLRASFHLCNLSFKQLSKTKGSIINVSLLNNLRISTNVSTAYSISKAGLDAMTRSLSHEWSRFGIRVNSVNLGHILSQKLDESIPRLLLEKLYPIGRFGRPVDVGNAVVFLASDLSAFINGINLEIDGGYHNMDAFSGAIVAKQHLTSDNFIKI